MYIAPKVETYDVEDFCFSGGCQYTGSLTINYQQVAQLEQSFPGTQESIFKQETREIYTIT